MSGMQEERRAASVAILETTLKRSFNEETQAAKFGVPVRKNTTNIKCLGRRGNSLIYSLSD